MATDWLNVLLAFIEGFALIISPCILPILPIILSGSLAGRKTRPIGIIVGFVLVFSIVLLFSRALIQFLHIDPDTLRTTAFILLILLGVMMMSSYLTEKFNLLTQRLTRVGGNVKAANNPESGFWGGFLFGGLVGIIWTPCAGPILAAIIVQVAIQQEGYMSILNVLAFAIGAGLPMLLIAWIGRSMMARFHIFRNHAGLFRKVLGGIIILTALFLMYDSGATSFRSSSPRNDGGAALSLINGVSPYPAPPIDGIEAWINSPPLQLSALKGKVVLIDFWTFSCINCIRTLPYLKDWYAKYHDKGFEIIGIQAPEFEFEKNLDNVKNAVKKFGITYPIALDNQFVTWRNYNNSYWPAHYLINKTGQVVYQSFGEGEYDTTENNIRYLLGITGNVTTIAPTEKYVAAVTPETYLGYSRAANFSNTQVVLQGSVTHYQYPGVLPLNGWALQGDWIVSADKIVAASAGASIKLHFYAGKVFAVMGVATQPVKVKLLLNGELLVENKGEDVLNSEINVAKNQLYSLVQFKQVSEGIVEITAATSGLEMYTFTFGTE